MASPQILGRLNFSKRFNATLLLRVRQQERAYHPKSRGAFAFRRQAFCVCHSGQTRREPLGETRRHGVGNKVFFQPLSTVITTGKPLFFQMKTASAGRLPQLDSNVKKTPVFSINLGCLGKDPDRSRAASSCVPFHGATTPCGHGNACVPLCAAPCETSRRSGRQPPQVSAPSP